MKLEISAELQQGDFLLKIDTVINEEAAGIFGSSGAGKSTLLHLLSGLKKPQRGLIKLNGRVLVDTSRNIFIEPNQRGIGVVFQDGRLFPHMNVQKNLLFGKKVNRKNKINFDSIIDILELRHLLKRRPANLSGGERQRVAIGRALLSFPDILLFDEPFSAIDTEMRRQLLPFISKIHSIYNIPFLIISHDLPELLMLTDYLLFIDKGRLINQGSSSNLIFNEICTEHLLNSGAGSSFYGQISSRDMSQGIAEIEIITAHSSNQPLKILAPYIDTIPARSYIRGRISPNEIILSSAPVEYISAQNQIRAIVTNTHTLRDRTVVEVNAGGLILLIEITTRSQQSFFYAPGKKIWVIFKTWSVKYVPCKKPAFSGGKLPQDKLLPAAPQPERKNIYADIALTD